MGRHPTLIHQQSCMMTPLQCQMLGVQIHLTSCLKSSHSWSSCNPRCSLVEWYVPTRSVLNGLMCSVLCAPCSESCAQHSGHYGLKKHWSWNSCKYRVSFFFLYCAIFYYDDKKHTLSTISSRCNEIGLRLRTQKPGLVYQIF